MSESTTPSADSQEAPATPEQDFVPAQAVAVEAPAQEAAPPQPVPAPEPAAPEAVSQLPAHHGLSIDERAYQQYQSLAQTVLDSADIASRSRRAAV